MDGDPRSMVEAPVRRAMRGVMLRGLALVAATLVLALLPLLARPSLEIRNGVVGLALGLLLAYAVGVRAGQRLRRRPDDEARASAWDRAKGIDADDAWLTLAITGWVPVGMLLALVLLLWPRVSDPNPATAASWVVFGLPPFVLGWVFATTAWFDACRDDLARAEQEADVALRRYWANLRT